MSVLFGIDCSSYQGNWDEKAAPAAGLAWGCEKATQGTGYVNPEYGGSITGMRAAGLIPGGYHFTDGSGTGGAQADHFVTTTGGGAGVFLMQDVEALGQIDRAHVVDWFVETNRLVPHRDLVCYTGQSFWATITGGLDIRTVEDRIGQRIVLWDAGDGHRPNVYVPGSGPIATQWAKVSLAGWQPYGGWTSADRMFLQFTDSAVVPGVSGPVDGDAFFGTPQQLAVLAGLAAPTAHISQEDDMFVAASSASKDGTVRTGTVWQVGPGARHWITDPAVWGPLQTDGGAKAVELTGDQIAAQWPAVVPAAGLDVNTLAAALAAALTPHLSGTVDVAALAAALAPGEQAAVEAGVKAVLAKAAA